eukprot:10863377-Lingulodinium_polyedra.AAC.1
MAGRLHWQPTGATDREKPGPATPTWRKCRAELRGATCTTRWPLGLNNLSNFGIVSFCVAR